MRRKTLASVLLCAALLAALLTLALHLSLTGSESDTPAGQAAGLGLMLEDTEEGLQVLAVMDNSAAMRAGLQPGDVLLALDGIALSGVDSLDSALQDISEGQLTIQRGETRLTILLRIPRR